MGNEQKNITNKVAGGTAFSVLIALSFTHLMNDTLQSIIPAIYSVIKDSLSLSFKQIGLITFAFQIVSSIFQPVRGWFTDKKPQPYSLPIGMTFTINRTNYGFLTRHEKSKNKDDNLIFCFKT